MFHIINIVIFCYFLCRFILPQAWTSKRKLLVTVMILPVAMHHLINRTFFGTLASPELPFSVIALQGWLFGAFILLVVLVLFKDLVSLLFWLLRVLGVPLKPLRIPHWGLALPLVALLLSAFGVWQAVRIPEVNTVEILLPRLPQKFDGLRIVQISDLHASKLLQGHWVSEVVDTTNALNPDLILITGDLIDGRSEKRTNDVASLRKLNARLGVFAIAGNHEYYSGYADWINVFHELGLHMLLNEHIVLTDNAAGLGGNLLGGNSLDADSLVLAGVTDKVAARFAFPLPDAESALSGAPQDKVIILMDHRPGGARENAKLGVDLQLSGHTHGGQILGLNLISQYMNGGFISGLYQVDRMQLYVSNGAGLWGGFPLRLGIPSEITQIVLRSPAEEMAQKGVERQK